MALPTLLDIAKLNGSDPLAGLIDETMKATPEVQLGYARPIDGTIFETSVRTSLPRGSFRKANDGAPTSGSGYEKREFNARLFNPRWECDKGVALAHSDGPEAFIALEADAKMKGAFLDLAEQFYYGTKAVYGTDGFPGLHEQYNTALTVDAGGGVNGTSVWAVKWGPQYTAWLWGNKGQISMEDLREESLTGPNGNRFTAYVQEILSYVGLQLGNKYSAGRIKGVKDADGYRLTDNHMFKLLGKFPAAYKPDAFLMTTNALELLRSSRTATNNTGTPAPTPTDVGGVPIFATEAIADDESTLVA